MTVERKVKHMISNIRTVLASRNAKYSSLGIIDSCLETVVYLDEIVHIINTRKYICIS